MLREQLQRRPKLQMMSLCRGLAAAARDETTASQASQTRPVDALATLAVPVRSLDGSMLLLHCLNGAELSTARATAQAAEVRRRPTRPSATRGSTLRVQTWTAEVAAARFCRCSTPRPIVDPRSTSHLTSVVSATWIAMTRGGQHLSSLSTAEKLILTCSTCRCQSGCCSASELSSTLACWSRSADSRARLIHARVVSKCVQRYAESDADAPMRFSSLSTRSALSRFFSRLCSSAKRCPWPCCPAAAAPAEEVPATAVDIL